MESENVQSPKPVTLVGGGDCGKTEIAQALAFAPILVASDGGANTCVKYGFLPKAVIGDFDSINQDVIARLTSATMIKIGEQNSSDVHKSLTRIKAPFIVAVGFLGQRQDHTLAAYFALAQNTATPTLLMGPTDFAFVSPDRLSLDLPRGTRVSLMPMTRATGRSVGLKWPIDGLTLEPLGRNGLSNEALGQVDLEIDDPGCLVILPNAVLPQAIAALVGQAFVPGQ